jgi:transcriptional regulator with XRE-family HTH domain
MNTQWFLKGSIKQMRKEKGLTQRKCALECEVSLVTWQNWESDITRPNQDNFEKIKKLFEVT